ncbi:putative lipoprotein [Streptomyces brasiliensis]|uniref:Lipoprotein n=1 Tax=Streptomyces brasiliensis TaxID=1954 RepID=A0A917KLF8_9ACTN|nr:putative lipoprotein [Streptomyces brasiliensis]
MRRGALTIAVTIALSGTGACTSSGSSGASGTSGRGTPHAGVVAALRSAEKRTDDAESARVRSTTTMGSDLSMTANGVLGWSDGTTGTVTIAYTGGTTADLMRKLGTTSMEARYLPDAYYAKVGERFAAQAGGKHWIRYEYADLAGLGNQMQTTAPHHSVKLLLTSGDVRKVGEETVRGEHTTHYTGAVDVAGLASGELKKQLTRAGVITETVDIWIDDRDLLVKKVEKGRTANGAYSQTAYYSEYGAKVSATRPPASDTEDFRDLLSKQGATPRSTS